MARERLEGGLINDIFRDPDRPGVVTKNYGGTELIGVSPRERCYREMEALQVHGQVGVAPRLIDAHDGGCTCDQLTIDMEDIAPRITQLDEYVDQVDRRDRQTIFRDAGRLLRAVHSPVAASADEHLHYYFDRIDTALEKADKISTLTELDAQEVRDMMTRLIDARSVRKFGVTHLHRDPWMNNFLYRAGTEPDSTHRQEGSLLNRLFASLQERVAKQDSSARRRSMVLIDWELAGIGSPYEDFAVVNLWVEREHPDTDAFWRGYGRRPNRKTLDGYVLGKCMELISTAAPEVYQKELAEGEGFYMRKVALVKEIMARHGGMVHAN